MSIKYIDVLTELVDDLRNPETRAQAIAGIEQRVVAVRDGWTREVLAERYGLPFDAFDMFDVGTRPEILERAAERFAPLWWPTDEAEEHGE